MANFNTNQNLKVIDLFYDNRKNLYDICGNIINKDKYKFIDILSTYLTDIVDSIDVEIKQSTRNSMINWREKKNPKLLSKFINSDDNINIINRSMNKITATNYMVIVAEITETLTQDNSRKLPDYSKFLFDTVIKKCLNDESFIKDYLNFLVGFEGTIGKYIAQYINQFILEMYFLLEKNNDLKSFVYFSYIKDITNYTNIGIIFANLYIIQNEKKTQYIITDNFIYEKFISCLNIINNFLDWMPSQIDELNGRIYMMFSIFETITKKIFGLMNIEDKILMNNVLNLIYNVNSIPNKIKFKVLDIKDIINTLVKENANGKEYNNFNSILVNKSAISATASSTVSTTVSDTVSSNIAWKLKNLNNSINTPVIKEEVLKVKSNIQFSPVIDEVLSFKLPITPKSIVAELPNIAIENKITEILENNSNKQQRNNQNRQRNYRQQKHTNGQNKQTKNDFQSKNDNNQQRNDNNQQRNDNSQRNNNNRNKQRKKNTLFDNRVNLQNNDINPLRENETITDDGFIKIERKNKNNSLNVNSNIYK